MNKELISFLKTTIIQAGDIALSLRRRGLYIEYKEDHSPVTNADKEVSDYIYAAIQTLPEKFPIICEEKPLVNIEGKDYFWLIDPIDGTRSFMKNKDTFTVNIALIKNKEPYLGLIYQPVLKKLYYTDRQLKCVIEEEGKLSAPKVRDNEHIVALVGSNHYNGKTSSFLKKLKVSEIISVPSSLKLGMIAEGLGDIYPNFRGSCEWDIAAGHAIINAAGGKLVNIDGSELQYAKHDFSNPYFLAFSKSGISLLDRDLLSLAN